MISRTIVELARIVGPSSMNGTIGVMLSKRRDLRSGAVEIGATLMRTFSQASPSMMSSPPRPIMMSLPSPPRMMLPVVNAVTALPSAASRSACRPSISAMLVSALPLTRRADLAADEIDGVVAVQEVGVRRSRQTFHDVEAGERGRARSRHRRLVEEAAVEVDRDADRVVLVSRPSRSRNRRSSGRSGRRCRP